MRGAWRAFGRDSFEGEGATMDSVFNTQLYPCPNATWSGVYTT